MNFTADEKLVASAILATMNSKGLLTSYSDANRLQPQQRPNDKRWVPEYGLGVTIVDKDVHVSVSYMYESEFDYDTSGGKGTYTYLMMQMLSELLSTTKVNYGSIEGYSSGCDTCGHNGKYEQKFFALGVTIDYAKLNEVVWPLTKTHDNP